MKGRCICIKNVSTSNLGIYIVDIHWMIIDWWKDGVTWVEEVTKAQNFANYNTTLPFFLFKKVDTFFN